MAICEWVWAPTQARLSHGICVGNYNMANANLLDGRGRSGRAGHTSEDAPMNTTNTMSTMPNNFVQTIS